MKNATKGRPEQIADRLIGRIFLGELAPGAKFSERDLAAQLKVDRTSLRMAMKQLQRMNLVSIAHGSGVVVNDYRTHAGLDFMAAVFAMDKLPLEGSFIVEALEFWIEDFSQTLARATARASLQDLRDMGRLLDQSLEDVDDLDEVVRLSIEMQDGIARVSGSIILQLMSNSTRALRMRLTKLFYETVDVKHHLELQRMFLRMAAAKNPKPETVRTAFRAYLTEHTQALREQLLFPSKGKKK